MIEIRKLNENPDYYLDLITMSLDTLHQKYLNAVDISDIIFYGYLYQEKKCFGLEYIMIDEFQDIDNIQYQLMEILCGYHKNLFVVGDPDQTIYSWRGANVNYLLQFDKVFPNVTTIMMNQNG